ncbi:MAG: hypothetical protein M9932_19615 [Xanthobacteraceae bacterium]|nr:hypothetical protein [Xanthobacteraceae bacterium]
MADDPTEVPTEAAAPDTGRPRRAPPTIDLEATEIPREPAADPSAGENSADPAAADADPRENPDAPPAAPRKTGTAVVAALTGALAACGVIGAAVWAGWPATPAPVVAPAPETSRIDALTKRLAALEARPAPSPVAAPDSAFPAPELMARLDALEKTASALRADLDALRAQEQQTATALDEVKTAPREAPAAPDLSPITTRLGQLETATRTLSAEAARQRATPADDKPLRRILAVTVLDRLVRQGDSYATALAAAKPLAPQPDAFKPLERFAASGVPSANTLSKDLLTRIAALTPPTPQPPEATGVLDRLLQGAERLVRIRRAGRSAGEGQGATVERAAAAARRDDVATARRELATLAEADRAPFQPWIELVDARDAALAASHQLAADAMAALGKPAP